jgi:hypothetical protein
MLVVFHVPFVLSKCLNLGANSYLVSSPQPVTVHGAFETTIGTRPRNTTNILLAPNPFLGAPTCRYFIH